MRTVNSDGGSRAHLGGRSIPVGLLAEFTDPLLTVHGQNDQLRLLRPDQQRAALDRFGGKTITALRERYRTHRRRWLDARAELLDRTNRARELAQEADRLQFGLDEIDSVAPERGEDAQIVADVLRLSDLDSLREAAAAAHGVLAGYDSADAGEAASALDLLGEARSRVEAATIRRCANSGRGWLRPSRSSPM